MPLEKVRALGWENVARLSNDHAEVLVTLDVGPRILSYKTPEGPNVLHVLEDQTGKTGEEKFVVRGGHRVWVSPENDRTYAPDNGPVRWKEQQPPALNAITPADARWGVRREMNVSLAMNCSAVMIQHVIGNEGKEPITVASWGLTIMAPGGWEIIPQPPLGTHGKELLPNRVIVPWTYTDLSDDRWRIGRRFWTLTPKKTALLPNSALPTAKGGSATSTELHSSSKRSTTKTVRRTRISAATTRLSRRTISSSWKA